MDGWMVDTEIDHLIDIPLYSVETSSSAETLLVEESPPTAGEVTPDWVKPLDS